MVVIGRRSARHAAFTGPELCALLRHPDIEVVIDPDDVADIQQAASQATVGTEATFALRQSARLSDRSQALAAGSARIAALDIRVAVTNVRGQYT